MKTIAKATAKSNMNGTLTITTGYNTKHTFSSMSQAVNWLGRNGEDARWDNSPKR